MRASLLRRTSRAKVIEIFEQMAELNGYLREPFKVKSYNAAIQSLRKDEIDALKSSNGKAGVAKLVNGKQVANLPGVGPKLVKKIDEILTTGDLKELRELESQPLLAVIRSLTTVHGVGPQVAKTLFEKHNITSVAQLREAYRRPQDFPGLKPKPTIQIGLDYKDEIEQRIPQEEMTLHAKLVSDTVAMTLGSHYTSVVCGSYRRQLPTSGDVDVLLSIDPRCPSATDPLELDKGSNTAIAELMKALRASQYVEATLAEGATKLMAVARLPSNKKSSGKYTARRLDIRYVPPTSFASAMLYFTGSKSFNVRMRTFAAAKGFLLNEYGLFRLPCGTPPADVVSGTPSSSKRLADESARVHVSSEEEIFNTIGMEFVAPSQRIE